MGQVKYVLENKNGQVTRVFSLENESLNLIYREDTRRVEAHADLEALKEQEIPFQVLLATKRSQIDKKGVEVNGVGTLRVITETEKFSPNYTLEQDNSEEKFKTIFKRSAVSQIAAALLIVGLGTFFGTKHATETTVTILPQEVVEQMIKEEKASPKDTRSYKSQAPAKELRKIQPQIVAPIDKKNPKRRIARGKARGGFKGPGKMGFGTNEPNMNSMGALNALDKISKTGRGNGGYGGTNMAAVGKGPGSGAGGKGYGGFGRNGGGGRGAGGIGGGGKMGLSNSMYGKGLIAAPFGNGSPAPGYGGYGTRGRAGGGEAGVGYGRASLVGSSKGLGPKGNGPAGSGGGGSGYGWAEAGDEDDFVVQGGLDMDQIAEVIMRNMGQITYCYEQGLQTKPDLSGRVRVKFLIGPQGRVTTAGITSSSVRSSKVENCIVNKLQAWNFPRPEGGVSVKVFYPFTLRRVGSN
jgi:hypothetical protein